MVRRDSHKYVWWFIDQKGVYRVFIDQKGVYESGSDSYQI